jgi:twitching motility protein PilT
MIDKINPSAHEHISPSRTRSSTSHQHKKCDGQPARAPRRHPLLRQRPALGPARGPRRGADRRDARPRDIESALRIAETGHLTFATLHTNSAPQTINRIVDVFPEHQQSQVRAQLSLRARGHHLPVPPAPRERQGARLAMEILIPNPAVRNLIREDKIHQIYSTMQTGPDQARDADLQPVPGRRCTPPDDLPADRPRLQLEPRGAAGHDQPRRRPRRPRRPPPAAAAQAASSRRTR